MSARTRERRPADGAAATVGENVETSLPEQARRLVEEAEQCCPDLHSWALGFCSGWDAAVSAVVQQRLDALAETIALHDQRPWVEAGQFSRERRIAREVAEMERRAAEIRAEIYGGGS